MRLEGIDAPGSEQERRHDGGTWYPPCHRLLLWLVATVQYGRDGWSVGITYDICGVWFFFQQSSSNCFFSKIQLQDTSRTKVKCSYENGEVEESRRG